MDMSNRTLAMFLVAAIVVSIAGTLISLNRLGDLQSFAVTGFATSDTGDVNLTIAESLNIEVDNAFNILDYDQCTPDAGVDLIVDLNNTAFDTGTAAIYNCTGDSASPQYLIIRNIGNIDANVSVLSECSSDELLGSVAGGDINLTSQQCVGPNPGYFPLASAYSYEVSETARWMICGNVSKSNPGNTEDEFRVSSIARIPSDSTGESAANPCGGDARMQLTFYAQKNY